MSRKQHAISKFFKARARPPPVPPGVSLAAVSAKSASKSAENSANSSVEGEKFARSAQNPAAAAEKEPNSPSESPPENVSAVTASLAKFASDSGRTAAAKPRSTAIAEKSAEKSATLPKPQPTELSSATAATPPTSSSNSADATDVPAQSPAEKPAKPVIAKKPAKRPAKQAAAARKLTPLEKQLVELKARNEDKLLAIQVGYKYKFYGEDARKVAQILNIMLVPHAEARFNYCSIPDNRLHIHLKRLLEYGFKVGVVKQTETAAAKQFESSKGLFERQITGVYTKATYLNEECEKDDINEVGEYIVAVFESQAAVGLVAVHPMSGEIVVDLFEDTVLREALETRLTHFKPHEVIAIGTKLNRLMGAINNRCLVVDVDAYGEERALSELKAAFSPDLYDYYKLNFGPEILTCINELAKYLTQFHLNTIFTTTSMISQFSDAKHHMVLSANVVKNLEIFENSTDFTAKGTLFWYLNHTSTKMGERLLRRWVAKPLTSAAAIKDRHDAISDLNKGFNHFIDCFKSLINKCNLDLEKMLMKIHYSCDGTVSKVSRKDVYVMLRFFNEVLGLVSKFSSEIDRMAAQYDSPLLKEVVQGLVKISESFDIEKKYLKVISSAHALNDTNPLEQKIHYFNLDVRNWEILSSCFSDIDEVTGEIDAELKNIRQILGRPSMSLVKNMNHDNLIEVRNTIKDKVPLDWIKINATKTVTRFRSPELERLNKKLIYHHETLVKNSDIVFKQFLNEINDSFETFSGISSSIAKFDCILSLAAASFNGVKAEITTARQIYLKNFRNPIVENLIDTSYITNDVEMSETNNRISVITGPNMGGKSTYIKSLALIAILNQVGSFLPCDEAKLGIFSSILLRMGSNDNILRGKSTFMIEMLECENIISNYDSHSLILLDEVGRGTSTDDGLAIAYAILRYFCESAKTPLILFITHFSSLGKLAESYDAVGNFHMDYDENDGEITFLYKVVAGVIKSSYGLNVAKLAGIPDSIVQRAKVLSEQLKTDMELKHVTQLVAEIKGGNVEGVFHNI